MDPLELTYDSLENVPEAFRGLYVEKDGKVHLAHINGMKTQADVANVQEALRKEREDHAKVRDALKPWKTLGDDPTEIQTRLDRMAELETAAGGKLDDAKLNEMVDARLGQKTAPLERNIKTLTEERDTAISERDALKNQIFRRDMNDAVRAVATEMKVIGTAVPDVEMVAANYLERDETTGQFIVKADAQGVTPGSDIKGFLKDMQKIRPHWWPQSQGGGAGGGAGFSNVDDNPWSEKGWSITKQGAYVKEHGMAKAQEAAKAVGSFVGATRAAAKSK